MSVPEIKAAFARIREIADKKSPSDAEMKEIAMLAINLLEAWVVATVSRS